MKWLVWLYPPRWRRRYGDELSSMIDGSVATAVDVLRGAIDAWLHPELGTPRAAPAAAAVGDRFSKFTGRSKTVLRLAQDEAARLQHPRIGAEHILLGLLVEANGVAAHMLIDRGVQLDELRSAVLERLGTGSGFDARCHGLDADAKRVIERSVAEARQLRHSYVGTEHLLLGLVADGGSVAADLLRERNVSDLAALRHQLLEILNSSPYIRRSF